MASQKPGRRTAGAATVATKIKIGTVLDARLLERLRVRAADRGQSLSEALESAIRSELAHGEADAAEATTAVAESWATYDVPGPTLRRLVDAP